MIKLPHNNGVISDSNLKKVPKEYVAKHSDGINWFFFETEDEYNDFREKTFTEVPIYESKEVSPLIKALNESSPEEIEEFKRMLNL